MGVEGSGAFEFVGFADGRLLQNRWMKNNSVPIVLKNDPAVGFYACVEESVADELQAHLVEVGTRIGLDSKRGVHLAEPGKRLFAFGKQHPVYIQNAIIEFGIPAEIDPGVVLAEDTYQPPVDRLLRLSRPGSSVKERHYEAFGREHVPELIRMATDETLLSGPSESNIVWAPIHAWWVLGKLRAEEAIGPLIGLLHRVDTEDDDWVGEDLPEVLAEIGPAALSPLVEYLTDSAYGEWARVAAARALGLIGEAYPETRGECVAKLVAQLAQFAVQSETLNAFLVTPLMDLMAVEAAPIMERAFACGCVDETVQGDWDDVQVELGLKNRRERPRKPNQLTFLSDRIFGRLSGEKDLEFSEDDPKPRPQSLIAPPKVGRNDSCPCGSGTKFKKCCGK
jgi:hypothetical protein